MKVYLVVIENFDYEPNQDTACDDEWPCTHIEGAHSTPEKAMAELPESIDSKLTPEYLQWQKMDYGGLKSRVIQNGNGWTQYFIYERTIDD